MCGSLTVFLDESLHVLWVTEETLLHKEDRLKGVTQRLYVDYPLGPGNFSKEEFFI